MSRKQPMEVNIGDKINIEPEGVYEGVVVKSGNGAVINSFKKFIGKKVVVILVNKMKKKKEYEREIKEKEIQDIMDYTAKD